MRVETAITARIQTIFYSENPLYSDFQDAKVKELIRIDFESNQLKILNQIDGNSVGDRGSPNTGDNRKRYFSVKICHCDDAWACKSFMKPLTQKTWSDIQFSLSWLVASIW